MNKKQKFKRNNPLNIRFNKHNNWLGLTGNENGFCVFEDACFGFRAAFKLLRNYYRWGYKSIRQIVTRFAPPTENPTDKYILWVCYGMARLGYSDEKIMNPDDTLDLMNDAFLCDLIAVMCHFESGKPVYGIDVFHEMRRSGWYDSEDAPTGVRSVE